MSQGSSQPVEFRSGGEVVRGAYGDRDPWCVHQSWLADSKRLGHGPIADPQEPLAAGDALTFAAPATTS